MNPQKVFWLPTESDLAKTQRGLPKRDNLKRPKGPISFKGHHEHVEFRNLRIKELP